MIFKIFGCYLLAEDILNVVYHWGQKRGLWNYVFQAGRIARSAIGVFMMIFL